MSIVLSRKWQVFWLTAVGVFMSTLDGSIVNVALPFIMTDFGVDLGATQAVMLVYLAVVSALLLVFGRISDIYGRKIVYSGGFMAFVAGSFFCGNAPGIVWLIGARSVQAIGAAMLMACSPAMLVDAFPDAERGRALGLMGTVVASGLTTGPALGGIILDAFSWRQVFYINVPIGIAALVIAIKVLPAAKKLKQREVLDGPGTALLFITIASAVFAFKSLEQWPRTGGAAVFLFAAAVISFGLFFIWEKKHPSPVFDPQLLKIRLFIWPGLSAMLLFGSMFTMVFLLPFYLLHPAGRPVGQVGYIMMTPFVCLFFTSPFTGRLYDKIGSRFLCTTGLVIVSIGLGALAMLKPQTVLPDLLWRLALVGIGTGTFIPPNSAAVMRSVPPLRRGVASGTVATVRNLGMVLGVTLAGLIFHLAFMRRTGGAVLVTYNQGLEAAFMGAFSDAMWCGTGIAVIGVLAAFYRGPDHPARDHHACFGA